MIDLILATDMSKHGDIMNAFKKANKTGLDTSSKEHRSLVNKMHSL